MDNLSAGAQEAAMILEQEIGEFEVLFARLPGLDRRGLEAWFARIGVLGRKWPSLLAASEVALGDVEGGLPPLIAQAHGRLTEVRRIIGGLGARASAPEAVELREEAVRLRQLCARREGEARRAAHTKELARLLERWERVCSWRDAMEQIKRSAEAGELSREEAEHEVNELAARSEEINLEVKGLVSDLDAAHAARCRVRAALEQEVARARSATPAKAATVEDPKASGGEGPKKLPKEPDVTGLDPTALAILAELRLAQKEGCGLQAVDLMQRLHRAHKVTISVDGVGRGVGRLRVRGFTIENRKNRSGYWLVGGPPPTAPSRAD